LPRVGLYAAWLATRAAMLVVLLHDVWHSRTSWIPFPLVSDVNGYWGRATDMVVHHQVPYVDFSYEYPPGSLPFVALARVLGRTPVHFVIAWLLLMLALDLVAVVLLDRWAIGHRAGAVFWVVGLAALGPIVLARNDMLPAVGVVAAAYLLRRGLPATSGVLWSFAIASKIWPAVLLLVVMTLRPRHTRRLLVGAAAGLAATAVALQSVGALTPMLHVLKQTQAQRPLEIEATFAALVITIGIASGRRLAYEFTYGSLNVPASTTHGLAGLAYVLSLLVQLGGIALAAIARWRKRVDTGSLAAWIWVALIAGGLAVAPVLSPQYLLWLLAVVSLLLVVDRSRMAIGVGLWCGLCAALTQWEFPFLWLPLGKGETGPAVVVDVRDACLVGIAVLASVVAVRRALATDERPSSEHGVAVPSALHGSEAAADG
jgi:hypothetical protein